MMLSNYSLQIISNNIALQPVMTNDNALRQHVMPNKMPYDNRQCLTIMPITSCNYKQ